MYSRAIDKAIYEVQSGTVDYHTAMRKTVRDLATGLRVKDNTLVVDQKTGEVKLHWDSGYSRRLDSHIRQNLIDGVKQLQSQMLDYHGERFGSDGVEISAHAISAPDHVAVQGRQFSNEEFFKMQTGQDFEDIKGNEYEGFKREIGNWNCRHTTFPIIIGISEPVYSEEQLKEFAENSKKKYDLTQQQRALETKLRSLKTQRLAASTAGDELEAKRLQRKINEQQTIYRRFSEKHNLLYDTQRASVEGYRRISVKNTAKLLENSGESGIIDLYKGKGISVIRNSEVSEETHNRVINATKRITSDFKVLESYSEPITYGTVKVGLAENKYDPRTGKNTIIFDKNAFANPDELLQSLKNDFANKNSYDTDNIESLVAHEMGHNAHIALALKRANIPYGKSLTQLELEIFNKEYNKISQEIYLVAFEDENFTEIQQICASQLGISTVENPHELIAQSFGNYYYGNKKSYVGEKIIKLFMKGLK